MPKVLDALTGLGRSSTLARKAAPESGELAPIWQPPVFVPWL